MSTSQSSPERFKHRLQAGRLLARQLAHLAGQPGLIVLALPRGGVPVGFSVARALGAELYVLLVCKLGTPGHEEFAMGAMAGDGMPILLPRSPGAPRVPAEAVDAACARASAEIARRERLYRGARPPLALAGRLALLVDDGLATGATMRAAVALARRLGAARVVVAIPVGAPDSVAALAPLVDDLVCLRTPPRFYAVSQWYDDFEQTTDDEVRDLLAIAWRVSPAALASQHSTINNHRST
ncbi:MAG: phosphoribosyltransferase family protein [Massilia sp.]